MISIQLRIIFIIFQYYFLESHECPVLFLSGLCQRKGFTQPEYSIVKMQEENKYVKYLKNDFIGYFLN